MRPGQANVPGRGVRRDLMRGIRGTGWIKRYAPALVAGAILASAAPALAVGETEVTSEQIVTLGGATSAQVEISLDFGYLRLAGGSLAGAGHPMLGGELLRAEFTDGNGSISPEIDYEVIDEVGHLVLHRPAESAHAWPWEDHRNGASLYLNPSVPIDLQVEVAAGQTALALGGMSLTDLDVEMGAGELLLDFAGDWQTDLAATVKVGAGDLTLRVPRDVGLRVTLDQGFGDVNVDDGSFEDGIYLSDDFADAPVTLDLQIELGAGEVDIDLVG